jgi:hypothetical protein
MNNDSLREQTVGINVRVKLLGMRFNLFQTINDITLKHTILPKEYSVCCIEKPEVGEYLKLYRSVGDDNMWWMRLTMSESELKETIQDSRVKIYKLVDNQRGQDIGFLEISTPRSAHIHIDYFGLIPSARGQGLGKLWLEWSLGECQRLGAITVSLTTNSADHPRALKNYLSAGFQILREVDEHWDIPVKLGLAIKENC